MPPSNANKAAHSGFENQRRHHQKSKTGISVVPQKRSYVLQIFLKKFFMFVDESVPPPGVEGSAAPHVRVGARDPRHPGRAP